MEEVLYVLGPVSSLLVWRAASRGVVDMPVRDGRQPDLRRSYARVRDLRTFSTVRALGDAILDVIVGSASRTHYCPSLEMMVLRGTLPQDSFCWVENGLYVCSPELCLVLLGRGGCALHLVELACELCGTYSIAHDQSGSFVNRPQLLSCDRMGEYLDALGPRHGCAAARKAIALAADGSDSPRETSMFLSFTLPSSMGGFGFPKPTLNGRIELSRESQKALGKSYLVPDEVYRDADGHILAIAEYDGKQYHLLTSDADGEGMTIDVGKVLSDDQRREVIRDEGIDLVSVRTEDTLDFERFEQKAMRLGRLLGIEVSSQSGRLLSRRASLFTRLFDTKRWHDEHALLARMAGYRREIHHRAPLDAV